MTTKTQQRYSYFDKCVNFGALSSRDFQAGESDAHLFWVCEQKKIIKSHNVDEFKKITHSVESSSY